MTNEVVGDVRKVGLKYRGLELGSEVPMEVASETDAYIRHPEPMPVGTSLEIDLGSGRSVWFRVTAVTEQVQGQERPPGMSVTAESLNETQGPWWTLDDSSAAEEGKRADFETSDATDSTPAESHPAEGKKSSKRRRKRRGTKR